MNSKLLLLAFFIYTLNGSPKGSESLNLKAEDVYGAALIVGCKRGPGKIDSKSFAEKVGQEKADFSHVSSQLGKVVSTDMAPCRINQPHVQGDWFTLPFARGSQKTVMFEWFPTCNPDTLNPHLLPAVQKAFQVLKPGGRLIIELQPYTISLPGDCSKAYSKLSETVTPEILKEVVLKKLPKADERYPGIVSALWQQFDPFTLSMSRREELDIFQLLCFEKQTTENGETLSIKDFDGQMKRTRDKQTELTAVYRAIDKLCLIFKAERPFIVTKLSCEVFIKNGIDKVQAYEELAKKMQSDLELRTENDSVFIDMFEWVYFMYARGPAMLEVIQAMGFTLGEDAINYHEVNPYNGRLHAWTVEAQKPA